MKNSLKCLDSQVKDVDIYVTNNFKIKLTTDYPAIVMFEDGKITSLLQENDKRDFNISTVKDYLELNMIGE